jgi:uncharacterized membrane protein
MIGFVFGTVCLVLLLAKLRRRAHYGAYAYGMGRGCGDYGAYYGYPPWARRVRDFGNGRHQRTRLWLRAAFERLETTPGQEKAIMKSVHGFEEQLLHGRGELTEVRKQVAQALGGDELDETILSAALVRVEDLIAKTKLDLAQMLTEIHASLDGQQRKALAELVAEGVSRRSFGF